MSNYKNFIQDFPVRCEEILTGYQTQVEADGREVTHVLAILAAALPIPFERLRKPADGIKHPSGDKKKYQQADGKFGNLCDKNFLGSKLFDNVPKSWKLGEVTAENVQNEPETWAKNSVPLPPHLKVQPVLEHLRNALAHGNIFTLPDSSDKIKEIIFLNRIMVGRAFTGRYKFLTVSPGDLNELLINWTDFLNNELKLPEGIT